MTWFHHTKLERFAKERRDRREAAEGLRESVIREEFYTDIHVIKDALREVNEEPALFEGYFGEPLPPHLADALAFELGIWRYLEDVAQRPVTTDNAYRELCKNLRPSLQVLCDLLLMEEEMVASCLVTHYRRTLDLFRAEFARVKV